MLNFKKNNIVVGVAITPQMGLEAAQIDFISKTILKYGCKQLNYDVQRREIADMDIFKDTLQDLLTEMQVPKGADIAFSIPVAAMIVEDYPAALDDGQLSSVIETKLMENPLFQNIDAATSAVKLPNSTMQFNKVASIAAQNVILVELANQIQDLGYNLINIDCSVNSALNALMYEERIDTNPSSTWGMLMVEANICKIMLMQGKNYADYIEEKVDISEVLEESENYAAIVETANLILKNMPSQYLLVVSKTNIINAETLAGKLKYSAPIIHCNANIYNKETVIGVSESIDSKAAKSASLDVIGAAINRDFINYSSAPFNLFNESLGNVWLDKQPLAIKLGSRTLVLSLENMIIASIVLAIIAVSIVAATLAILEPPIIKYKNEISDLTTKKEAINKFLKENENISRDLFDEGGEIEQGVYSNKNIYTYYTIVGTEIPQKLWLTSLHLGAHTTIEGQADNLESVYSFFRNIKDYNPESDIKLQKLGLASKSGIVPAADDGNYDTDSIITSMSADFYHFKISDAPEVSANKNEKPADSNGNSDLPELEPIE